MPIAEKIYSILYESYDPKKAISDLMNRELKAE
jgi:glycerol-3-phosphate dehydrogenase